MHHNYFSLLLPTATSRISLTITLQSAIRGNQTSAGMMLESHLRAARAIRIRRDRQHPRLEEPRCPLCSAARRAAIRGLTPCAQRCPVGRNQMSFRDSAGVWVAVPNHLASHQPSPSTRSARPLDLLSHHFAPSRKFPGIAWTEGNFLPTQRRRIVNACPERDAGSGRVYRLYALVHQGRQVTT